MNFSKQNNPLLPGSKVTPIIKEIDAVCPNCEVDLKKVPQKKTKCPHCGKYIYYKYSPSNPVKRLVTEAENELIEIEWQNKYLIDSTFSKLYTYKITREEIEKEFAQSSDIDAAYKKLYLKAVELSGELAYIGILYFEIAEELYPGDAGLRDNPMEYIGLRDNYYEAVFSFYTDLLRSIKSIKDFLKSGKLDYQIDAYINNHSNKYDVLLDGQKFNTHNASRLVYRLSNVKTKDELIKVKPLLFHSANSEIDSSDPANAFVLPPFTLGCTSSISPVLG